MKNKIKLELKFRSGLLKRCFGRVGLLGLWWVWAASSLAQEVDGGFVENRGQWPEAVWLRTEMPNGFAFLRRDGLAYTIYDGLHPGFRHHEHHSLAQWQAGLAASAVPLAQKQRPLKAHGLRAQFVSPSAQMKRIGQQPSDMQMHFFLGVGQAAPEASIFAAATYHGVYPGIDCQVYRQAGQLKYDWLIAPGADPSQIRLRYQGHDQIQLDAKGLVLSTSLGQIVERHPVAYQQGPNGREPVACRFVLEGDEVHLELGAYDPKRKLVIDPEVFFATYSESVSDNWGNTATYDRDRLMYVGGTVFGGNFPITVGAFQTDFAGQVDIAIYKVDVNTGSKLFGTLIGGFGVEVPTSMIVKRQNELLILGVTGSANFPVTTDVVQRNFGSGTAVTPISGYSLDAGADIFVAMLSADGRQMRAATYLGGSQNDGLNLDGSLNRNYGDALRGEIIVDGQDQVWFVSNTNSRNFPVTDGSAFAGGQDAVVVGLSADLSALVYSGFLGTAAEDAAYSLALADDRWLYVVGGTNSQDFPTTPNARQTAYGGGSADGFIARYDLTLPTPRPIAVSYLGTSAYDQAYLVDTDPSTGEPVVFGQTTGSYPISPATVYRNEGSGQFLHKLSADLERDLISTVVGSGRSIPDMVPTALLVDQCGSVFLAGWGGMTNSPSEDRNYLGGNTTGLPTTADGFRETDGSDFYMMILNPEMDQLNFGSFLGGSRGNGEHVDGGTSRFDPEGGIYHAVCACNNDVDAPTNFPSTDLTFNRSENCNNAAFYYRLGNTQADFEVSFDYDCQGLPSVSLRNTSVLASRFDWQIAGVGRSNERDLVFQAPAAGPLDIQLAVAQGNCRDTTAQTITIDLLNPPNVITPNEDGKNDHFDVGVTSSNWTLEVYNRWGNRVHQQEAYQNDWDGGQLLNGTYYYLLRNTNNQTCKGWLKIIRQPGD